MSFPLQSPQDNAQPLMPDPQNVKWQTFNQGSSHWLPAIRIGVQCGRAILAELRQPCTLFYNTIR